MTQHKSQNNLLLSELIHSHNPSHAGARKYLLTRNQLVGKLFAFKFPHRKTVPRLLWELYSIAKLLNKSVTSL